MIEEKIEKAEALIDINRNAEAIKILTGCYGEEPDNLSVLVGLSNAFWGLRDTKNALSYARQVVNNYPDIFQGYLLVANVHLYLSEKNYREAVDSAEKAFQIEPENPQILELLFLAYFKSDDFENARRTLRLLENVAPESDSIHFNRGMLEMQNERFDAAERSFRQALEINPENEFAMHNLALSLSRQTVRENNSIFKDSTREYVNENQFNADQQKQAIEHFYLAAKISPGGSSGKALITYIRIPPVFSILFFLVFLALNFLTNNSGGYLEFPIKIANLLFFFTTAFGLSQYIGYLKLKRRLAPEIQRALSAGEREKLFSAKILHRALFEFLLPVSSVFGLTRRIQMPILRWVGYIILSHIFLIIIGLIYYSISTIFAFLSG